MQRSSFVTVLAWLLIVFAGFMVVIGLLQNIMIYTFMPIDELPAGDSAAENMPGIFRFLLSHVRLLFLLPLVLSTVSLISAIGLLKRKNWARLVFVAMFALGILVNMGGLVIQHFVMSSMPESSNAPAEFQEQFDRMETFITVFSAFVATAFSVLFGWLSFKLLSRDIRAEFQASA